MKIETRETEEKEKEKTVKIGLIALDLDGTTLRSDRKIGARTREALRRAMESGVHVVIATGRSLHSLPEEVLSVHGIEYAITCNGAKIVRLSDRSILYTNYLSPSAVQRIMDFLKDYPNLIEIFVDGQAYVERGKLKDLEAYGVTGTSAEYVRETRMPVDGLFDFLWEHRTEIENINVRLLPTDCREKLWKRLEALGEITVTSSFRQNIELGGATTSKAAAMLALADLLGVAHGGIMACGDGLNDLAMLQAAGVAVAMGNSVPEVRAAADFITEDNDHDGVGVAVEKFVWNPKESRSLKV